MGKYMGTCRKCLKPQEDTDSYVLLQRDEEITCEGCLQRPWVITHVHLTGKPNTYVSKAFKAKAKKFRVRDDDGETYFEGYALEETFAPLDWAQPQFGATEIQYLTNGQWRTL